MSRPNQRTGALAYAREGARVAISYHSKADEAEKTARAISEAGGEPLAVRLDLEDFESARTAVQTIVEAWGGIDSFVANAIQWPDKLPDPTQKFEDVPADEWQSMIRGNIEETIASLQAVLPAMRGRPDGRIVLMSSDIARNGNVGSAFYGGLGSTDAATQQVNELISMVGRPPTTNTVTQMSRYDAMMRQYGCSDVTVTQCHRMGTTPDGKVQRTPYSYDRNRIFAKAVPGAGVDAILGTFDKDRRAGQSRVLWLLTIGGRPTRSRRRRPPSCTVTRSSSSA